MMVNEQTPQDFEPYTVRVSAFSIVRLLLIVALFGSMSVVGIYRNAENLWNSGWIMRGAAVCLAVPGVLSVVVFILALRIRLTLTSERISYQGPIHTWSILLENLKSITVHHLGRGGLREFAFESRMSELPVGAIEFHTENGKFRIRCAQLIQLAEEIEDITHEINRRWRARTRGERLDVKHVRMSFRNMWTLTPR
jgi:hypothetical protein